MDMVVKVAMACHKHQEDLESNEGKDMIVKVTKKLPKWLHDLLLTSFNIII